MSQHSRGPARTHALRIDPPAMVQGGIAASISILVAWFIQVF